MNIYYRSLLIGTALICLPSSIYATTCVSSDCTALGYTMIESNCDGDSSVIRCPFDTTKVFCKEKAAETLECTPANYPYESPNTKIVTTTESCLYTDNDYTPAKTYTIYRATSCCADHQLLSGRCQALSYKTLNCSNTCYRCPNSINFCSEVNSVSACGLSCTQTECLQEMVCDQSKTQYYCTTGYYCCDLDANDGNPINCGMLDKGSVVGCSFAQETATK